MLLFSHRHVSDSKLRPLSKANREDSTTFHTASTRSHSHTPVHPYSSVSDEMGQLLSGVESSRSHQSHFSNERYQKLEDSYTDTTPHETLPHSKSSHDLGLSERHGKEAKGSLGVELRQPSHRTQKDRIASIRDDIQRFTKDADSSKLIPSVSSRWSKFMTETEREEGVEGEGEEEGEGEGEGEGEDVHVHMLQSKLAVAKYT